MNIKLFDKKDGRIIPSDHCYKVKALKDIMEEFQENENYLKVYDYLFHTYCPDPERNPFLNVPEEEKDLFLKEQFGIDFSLDKISFDEGHKFFEKIFTTPSRAFYLNCKIGVEKQGKYLRTTTITSGRDGNDTTYLNTLKNMATINDQFAKVEKAYEAEIKAAIRGGGEASYDENDN